MNAVSDTVTVYSENLILALLTLNLFRAPQLDIFNYLKEVNVYMYTLTLSLPCLPHHHLENNQ